ncbi:MAG: response regulator [Chloroflexales bacterium]|nr:response regulator [Chloroflexales bacterium]
MQSGKASQPPDSTAEGQELHETAGAVDSALLYRDARRRLAELATVQRVAQAITAAVHLDQLCATVVEQVGSAFGYRLVSIYLRDGETLRLRAAIGYDHVLKEISLSQGVSGRVVRTGQPCFVRDTAAEPDFLHAVPQICQGIMVPLIYAEGPALGVIAVESTGAPLLTDDDLSIISLLADQISVAVVNARLFARVEDAAKRFSSLVESAASVIICLDLELKVSEFNREAERVFGLSRAEALSQDYLDRFVAPADQTAVATVVLAAIAGSPARPFETLLIAADGTERAFFWTITCHRNPAGSPSELLVIGQDITERRAAEQARLAMERKMLESQRLESLGVLAGGIAHDFNNLLAAILGNASLLLFDLPPGSEAYQSARQIELVTARAADLVRQMLAYAGRGRFVMQPLDLNALVAEMIVLLRVSVSKGATLIQHLSPRLPLIEGDPAQIRQVVMNLIINASEALGPQSGTITIATALHHVDMDTLAAAHVGADLPQGLYVGVTIADTGIGMDAATRARIFDPFFTTKFAGRGLGLAAVLGIVRSHHGALLLESERGYGSTFTALFPIPRQAPTSDAVASADNASPAPRAGSERPLVLVIDDEDEVRRTTARILERGGYTAISATDGESALTICRSLHQPISAVILDLTMPYISGEQVFRDLRRERPELPVLLMSGYSAEEMSARFPGEMPSAFLQKPFSAATLLALVGKAVVRAP